MLATERLLEIEEKWAEKVHRIVVLEIDGETLQLIIYLKDGTNLRVTEEWAGAEIARYSYYWLNPANDLKVGWDNAPHYTRLENFPHHKHVGKRKNIQVSFETTLEEVMKVIFSVGY
jgi:hypothetical protein